MSDHEEADTRLFFHAGMSKEAAAIIAKDAEVFLLLIRTLGQLKDFLLYPLYR